MFTWQENELKDSSLLQTYSSYLQTFKDTLEQPASLQCMLPADLPTCDFLIDMLLHLCCMPVRFPPAMHESCADDSREGGGGGGGGREDRFC